MSTVHVVPLADVVEHLIPGGLNNNDLGVVARWLAIEADPHAPDVECCCGPVTEHVPPSGWLITHHSLDGRERTERDAV